MFRFLILVLAACITLAPSARAGDMVQADLRPGWRLADGRHVAALQLQLAPGWKTYWRAPGDAGIPPLFDWQGSQNASQITVSWPTPDVFWQSGMRSVGYHDTVVLPFTIVTETPGPVHLRGEMELGLCKDICIPHRLRFDATLDGTVNRPDPVIAAALADVPFSASEAKVRSVGCTILPDAQGLTLRAVIDMPTSGGTESTVIEAGNPLIWVAEPETNRQGNTLTTAAQMRHMDGGPIALDRSAVRITVLGTRYAVDIQGCR